MVAAAKFIHREMPEPQVIMTVIDIMGPPVVMAAGRSLAGCLDWSNWHCRPIYIGKVGNRAVFGRAGADLNLRSRLFTDGDLGVGVYYSALIFFLGAEFTYVYAHRCGSRRPTRSAVVVE